MLFYLRCFLIALYLFLVGAVGILVCLARPFHPDNTRWFARIYSWGGAAILGIKIRRHNYGSLNNIGPCVYVVNHQHNFDLFITGRVVAKRTVTVGKKSLRWLPFFGQLYWLAGNVLIDRKNQARSSATVNEATQALMEKNTSIWVFAEGTRNRGKNMLPFKRGAFVMAIEAGVPIIPICVSSYVRNMDLHRLKSGIADIRILPPIMTDRLTMEDIPQIMKQCWENMKETIEAMDRAVYSVG